MNTSNPPVAVIAVGRPDVLARCSRIMPAILKLTAHDFKVCEICAGPAMPHPRFELAQIVAGERTVLCCSCMHGAAFGPAPVRPAGEIRPGDQLWKCRPCGKLRGWGLGWPGDRHALPALRCSSCERVTRHAYDGVARDHD